MFQPKIIVVVAVLLAALNAPVSAGSKHSNEATKLDPKNPDNMCRIVNEAYVRTRHTALYREIDSIVTARGTFGIDEYRITASGMYGKPWNSTTWSTYPAEAAAPVKYPRFTSCIYVNDIGGPHFRAHWHNRDPSQTAIADVWLTSDVQRLHKVVRRFPDDDPQRPSQVLMSVMDYDRSRAVAPAKESILPYTSN
ncbi:hypothetical protein [Rhizobium sp. BK068]|uniref:hypothetical protein n=1 Tax=Rhizobium sp. BK068 TaxID=2512130 RepID=UPI00104C3510|nr:hypothetical protein [Rhizobium sp. BK068]TCM78615.1 hypothetical protein EV291_105237 [Rhizobium sp. BK068]